MPLHTKNQIKSPMFASSRSYPILKSKIKRIILFFFWSYGSDVLICKRYTLLHWKGKCTECIVIDSVISHTKKELTTKWYGASWRYFEHFSSVQIKCTHETWRYWINNMHLNKRILYDMGQCIQHLVVVNNRLTEGIS